MKSNKRNWTNNQKFKIVLETFNRDKQLVEIQRQFNLAPSVLHRWRKHFTDFGPEIFNLQSKRENPYHKIEDLENIIGKITVENQILKKALSSLD